MSNRCRQCHGNGYEERICMCCDGVGCEECAFKGLKFETCNCTYEIGDDDDFED